MESFDLKNMEMLLRPSKGRHLMSNFFKNREFTVSDSPIVDFEILKTKIKSPMEVDTNKSRKESKNRKRNSKNLIPEMSLNKSKRLSVSTQAGNGILSYSSRQKSSKQRKKEDHIMEEMLSETTQILSDFQENQNNSSTSAKFAAEKINDRENQKSSEHQRQLDTTLEKLSDKLHSQSNSEMNSTNDIVTDISLNEPRKSNEGFSTPSNRLITNSPKLNEKNAAIEKSKPQNVVPNEETVLASISSVNNIGENLSKEQETVPEPIAISHVLQRLDAESPPDDHVNAVALGNSGQVINSPWTDSRRTDIDCHKSDKNTLEENNNNIKNTHQKFESFKTPLARALIDKYFPKVTDKSSSSDKENALDYRQIKTQYGKFGLPKLLSSPKDNLKRFEKVCEYLHDWNVACKLNDKIDELD